MSTTPTLTPAPRKGRHLAPDYIERGLPDPRPVTDYGVTVDEDSGVTTVVVKLDQPCVVREPAWQFRSCVDNSVVKPDAVTVVDNTTIKFKFAGVLDPKVNLIEVPYQDTQVQNFQGGFVAPGARWFRAPTLS